VQHRSVILNNQRLHYYVWGEDGPPLVLIHATGFHGYVWKPIAESLSRQYRVIAPDQRGHGDSEKPESGYAWDVFGNDLHEFLDALHLRNVAAVGHSAGATTIALCAAAYPGAIGRAILIDPILFPRTDDGERFQNTLAERTRKRRMVWASRTVMFESFHTRPPFQSWREDVLHAYIEEGTRERPDGQIELKCPATIEAQIFEMAPQLNGFEVLPRVGVPALVLRGANSEAFPASSAAHAVQLLPHGRLETVPDTTHFLPMERPDVVERAVRAFLAS